MSDEKKPDAYYLARSKELVNILYDKRYLADSLTRETKGMSAMEMLYNETRVTTDIFRYNVNQGGELDVRVGLTENQVEVVFENGKYARCKFNFRGPYTRSHWYVLRGIADKIAEIEARLK